MKRTFLVVYEKGKKNYGGFAPDVAGCGSLGGTLEEIRANLKEALQLYIDYSAETGRPIPEAKTTHVTLPMDGEPDPNMTYVVERITVNIPTQKSSKPTTSKRRVMQAA